MNKSVPSINKFNFRSVRAHASFASGSIRVPCQRRRACSLIRRRAAALCPTRRRRCEITKVAVLWASRCTVRRLLTRDAGSVFCCTAASVLICAFQSLALVTFAFPSFAFVSFAFISFAFPSLALHFLALHFLALHLLALQLFL